MKALFLLGVSFLALTHISQADVARDTFSNLNQNKTSLQIRNLGRNGIHIITLRGQHCSLEAMANFDTDPSYDGGYRWVDGAIGKDKSWAMYNTKSESMYADKRIWIQCDSDAPIPSLDALSEDIRTGTLSVLDQATGEQIHWNLVFPDFKIRFGN